MTPTDIANQLSKRFGDAITESLPEDKHPRVHTTASHWREVAAFLAHDPDLAFDWLGCVTAVDYVGEDQLCAVYDLYSTKHRTWFAVKVYVDRADAHIPSVMDIWPAANWHEREAYDLMGIVFDDHADLRRILLPEDWQGYPLRKDYVFPHAYHGIPGTYETDWKQWAKYPK
ncbi:MAG: NADH-quinone oxidoreductase subunit C [Phycisphaeraceae bacterium]|jgi:NADH-quinone oxidoreductase subunit C|nr:NADH-quinone oxidoreductase subunit C [Phycisphaeraceae bacterium]